MKVSDYIAKFFEINDINKIFSITGGFSMFMNDSFGRNKSFDIYYQHHEQACAYSAVGYSRITNKPSIVCTTAGCAATNAITPCLVAYQDSVPVIFISGQVKTLETTTYIRKHNNKRLRHYSGADCEIIDMVKNITKYSQEIYDHTKVPEILERALYEAINGRPGPVWLSIPLDIQSMNLPDDICINKIFKNNIIYNHDEINKLDKLYELLEKSERPVLILGNGIRLSDSKDKLNEFIDKYKIPCVVSFHGTDMINHYSDYYIGKIGLLGDRAGNFCMQNSDLLISFGCRLSQGITGYNINWFAREAKKVIIDIDEEELNKDYIAIDLKIKMDLFNFFNSFNFTYTNNKNCNDWISKCNDWKNKWHNEMPLNYLDDMNGVNPYYVLNKFYNIDVNNKITVCSGGSIVTNLWHMISIKDNDRFIISSQGDMGFELPASIGCQIANPDKKIICVVGDGSIQLNIQELQTICQYKLPIKILLFNNSSYGAISITQNGFFGNKFGVDIESGISFPNYKKIAETYNINYLKIEKNNDINNKLNEFMNCNEAIICEVVCCIQPRNPKLNAKKNDDGTFTSKPLEDLEPFLDREEFKKEMIVKII
jgi:acetolactate synthase-1/2/3 large subunit